MSKQKENSQAAHLDGQKRYDCIIIGGGPAGLGVATHLSSNGVKNILIVEREDYLGGILLQCIHNGFGLHEFKEELTGPEYAQRFINQVEDQGIEYMTGTMAVQVTPNKEVHVTNESQGYQILSARTVVFATGCRERNAGGIQLVGKRLTGVITAGTAQKYLNIDGYLVGKKVFILGSGDIGLIMARRMTLEGAKVLGVAELMPYSNGLTRNIVQCLNDYDIPLYLSHTITNVKGSDRVESITISQVDSNRQVVAGTDKTFDVDCLLLSVGLIPDNKLGEDIGISLHPRTRGPIVKDNMEADISGFFACGNALHVHDLVDYVTEESRTCGQGVIEYLNRPEAGAREETTGEIIETAAGSGISYIVPQQIKRQDIAAGKIQLLFRTTGVYQNVKIGLKNNGKLIRQIAKAHLVPAEMERIAVSQEDVLENGTLELEVLTGN